MQKLIYFNRPDCPQNMGVSQLTDDLNVFLEERKDIIIDPIILSDRITFTKSVGEDGDNIYGYALYFEVPQDFNN